MISHDINIQMSESTVLFPWNLCFRREQTKNRNEWGLMSADPRKHLWIQPLYLFLIILSHPKSKIINIYLALRATATSAAPVTFILLELSLKLVMCLICRSLLTFSLKVFNYFSCRSMTLRIMQPWKCFSKYFLWGN